MRSWPSRVMVIWPCTSRCVPSRAVFIISSSSGSTSDNGWSSVPIRRDRSVFPRAVEDADAARRVDADNARAGRRQHRLDEPAAAVDQFAGVH